MSRVGPQAPMQVGSGLGSPVRRGDVWFAPDCVRSYVRACATMSVWVAPTILTVMSVLTIPVLAQQPNRPAIDAHAVTTHLRGATGSGERRTAQLKQSADTKILKLAQATISNTERSRQALAPEQERVQALAGDLRTCRQEQDTVLGLLQHAREQWNSIAEAAENETEKLQKSLREERSHTQRLERELATARNDLELQARLSREIGTEGRDLKHPAQSDPRELQQAAERERDRANRLERDLTAAHHDLETQSAELTKQAAAISAKEAAEKALADVQASLRQEHDRTKQLEETLATTRFELDNRSWQIAKATEETAQTKRTAENTSAKLKLALKEEHEKADALAQELSLARSKLFAYEAQAAADDDRAEQLKKQLGRERHQSSGDEQELAAARPNVGPWLPAAVSGEGGAGNSPTRELLRTLLLRSPQPPPEQSPRELVVIPAEPKAQSPVLGNEHAAELVRLIARATGLLRQGDIGAARVVLERAVELGSAPASFALAETYDPRVLTKWGANGTRSDASKARELYARAAAGGFKEAEERFDALGH
ncbi:hypothetical protein ACVWXO_005565 [Bradyrhizobium sp. LM2.7]